MFLTTHASRLDPVPRQLHCFALLPSELPAWGPCVSSPGWEGMSHQRECGHRGKGIAAKGAEGAFAPDSLTQAVGVLGRYLRVEKESVSRLTDKAGPVRGLRSWASHGGVDLAS